MIYRCLISIDPRCKLYKAIKDKLPDFKNDGFSFQLPLSSIPREGELICLNDPPNSDKECDDKNGLRKQVHDIVLKFLSRIGESETKDLMYLKVLQVEHGVNPCFNSNYEACYITLYCTTTYRTMRYVWEGREKMTQSRIALSRDQKKILK